MSQEILHPKQPPGAETLTGQYVRLEKVEAEPHADGFDRHLCGPEAEVLWEHIPFGPPRDGQILIGILGMMAESSGWQPYALRDLASDEVKGTVSLMRIRPEHGSAEIGCVVFGTELQRTRSATEAVYLLAEYLFDTLGYRRFEWKCDSLNQASRNAAERFGFKFEGIFRNDMIVKGRNRDTAWFAMTDGDWAGLKPAYNQWLSDENFDGEGRQKASLSRLID